MVVRSKVDLLPAPIENRIETTEESDGAARNDDLQNLADVSCVSAAPSTVGACEELHWNEARRIYSEPTAELYRSESISSLASQESDNVFLEVGDGNEELQCRTGTIVIVLGILLCSQHSTECMHAYKTSVFAS